MGSTTRPLRVVQWATGNVGTASLRAVIGHSELDLVGLWVHSDDKVGRDAGELCDLDPVGVTATSSIDEILALGADCVMYMPQGCDFDVMCRILASGTNVVTTRHELLRPESMAPDDRRRVEDACAEGNTSVHSTGSSPGFISATLPLAVLSMERRVDRLRIDEFADMSSRNSPQMIFELMGFGRAAEDFDPRRFQHTTMAFGPALQVLADAVGVPVDRIEGGGDVAIATRDVEIAAGTVPAGTIAAMRPTVTAFSGDTPRFEFRAHWYLTTDLEPAWDLQDTGWRVQVEGDTPLDVRVRFPVEPERYPLVSPGFTAHPAVNAVAATCAAAPGIRTAFDLPVVPPTFT